MQDFVAVFSTCWHQHTPIVSSLCDFFVFSIVGCRAAASDSVSEVTSAEKFQAVHGSGLRPSKILVVDQLRFGMQAGYGVKHLNPGRTAANLEPFSPY